MLPTIVLASGNDCNTAGNGKSKDGLSAAFAVNNGYIKRK